jgi:undecaprenyl-diphosphatase
MLPRSAKPLMRLASMSGEPLTVAAITAVVFIKAINNNSPDIVLALVLAGMAYSLNILLRQTLHRPRPNNLKVTTLGIKSYSFPSGHAFGSVIFYGLFAYLAYGRLSNPWGTVVAVLVAGLILLIGVSRVYLKAHYPSDVIAGWILGLFSLYVVIALAF